LTEPILVGRERELAELEQFLNSAIAGKGATVFVSGEAGSGKTRLTSEFLNLEKNKNVAVLTGWCLSNVAVPYFPFVEAFGSYTSTSEDQAVSLVPQQLGLKSWLMGASMNGDYGRRENVEAQVWKEQAFAAVAKELFLLATKRPTILVLEDIHWADSASLSLLHYVSRAIRSERILVVATIRSEELSPPADGQPHPLVETLRLMGREDLFKEIKLANLSEASVGRVAESMLDGRINPEFLKKLAAESQGNPLFIVESLRMLHEIGDIVQDNGEWRLVTDRLSMPTKVKDIILRRLSALKSEERRVLDAASVVGDKFDPELLGAVLDQDSLRVLESLNKIAHSNSLVCFEKNIFRFDHARSKEVVYEEIYPPLRSGYHARIAERLESRTKNVKQPPVSDLAYHYAKAGNREKSIEYSLKAGEDALAKFGNSEAIKHFSYVLDSVLDQENVGEKTRALEGLGSALLESGRQSEAIAAFEQVLAISNSDLAKLRALRKAMFAANYQGDLPTMRRLVAKSAKIHDVDRLESARILLYKGTAARIEEAVKDIESALKIFESEYSLPDVGNALIEAGICYGEIGRLEEGLAAGLRSLAILENPDDLNKMIIYAHLAYDFLACGFLKESLSYSSEAIKLGEKIDNVRTAWPYVFSAAAHNLLAAQSKLRGAKQEAGEHVKMAIAQLLKAVQYSEKADEYYILSSAYSALLGIFAAIGEITKAEEYDKKISNLRSKFGDKMDGAVLKWYPGAKAALHAARGQWNDANSLYEKAIELHKNDQNTSLFEASSRMAYAGILLKQGRMIEAKMQSDKGWAIVGEIRAKFEHAKIFSSLIAPMRVLSERTFKLRLDIVNVSPKTAEIERVEGLVPSSLKVFAASGTVALDDIRLMTLKEKRLGPFHVLPIELTMQATQEGTVTFRPRTFYLDEMGIERVTESEPRTLSVYSATPQSKSSSARNLPFIQAPKPAEIDSQAAGQTQTSNDSKVGFEFKVETAKLTFNYLVRAFAEDYMRKKIAEEKAGWRTLMDIVKDGKVPKYSVYGEGRKGAALAELVRRGLVEARVFPGERGRGGKITKVRVCYEKEPIKNQISDHIMKES